MVLVYDLLLEMLDANTSSSSSSSSSQSSSSPGSDSYSDLHQFSQNPSHLQPTPQQTPNDHNNAPAHGQILEEQLHAPFHSQMTAHMDRNE